MVSRKTDKRNSGVPSSYSSTELPTPRKVLSKLASPIGISGFLLTLSVATWLITGALNITQNIQFNPYLYPTFIISFLVGSYICSKPQEKSTRQKIPSIQDVSMTKEYAVTSSRVVIITISAGLISIGSIVVLQLIGFSSINSVTRLSAIISLFLAFLFSYTIVYTLCSYTPFYDDTFATIPVNVSSLPEIITLLGFIFPPSIVFYAGFVYDRPSFIQIPFTVTIIDVVVVTASIMILYISYVSKLN